MPPTYAHSLGPGQPRVRRCRSAADRRRKPLVRRKGRAWRHRRPRIHCARLSLRGTEWTFDYGFDPKMGGTLTGITGASDAILLGRTTYEMFAPAWSARTAEDDPGAPFFNDTHKYVVTSQPPNVDWGPSTHLPYDPEAIRRLKDDTDGLIYVSGSGTLVRALLRDGLIDICTLRLSDRARPGKRLWATSRHRSTNCERARCTTTASCTSTTDRPESWPHQTRSRRRRFAVSATWRGEESRLQAPQQLEHAARVRCADVPGGLGVASQKPGPFIRPKHARAQSDSAGPAQALSSRGPRSVPKTDPDAGTAGCRGGDRRDTASRKYAGRKG